MIKKKARYSKCYVGAANPGLESTQNLFLFFFFLLSQATRAISCEIVEPWPYWGAE